MDAFEAAAQVARGATAQLYAACARVIADAMAYPDAWCGPDPTRDPAWRDPRDRAIAQVRASRAEFAERAAVCDLAVRVHVSERTIRARADTARILQERCPRTWAAFCDGLLDERNADTAADLAITLPADDPETWATFDQRAADTGQKLPVGKFRTWARALRERLASESIDARHERAAEDRRIWTRPELDGMADLGIHGPAADVHAADTRVDRIARHLHEQEGETRTLAQLRADVALALLNGATVDGAATGAAAGRPAVAITVPVMTLLGRSDEPAILDGFGPIDLNTAKRLAGDASSWVRILTHPVDGTVLDVDRTTYRIPKALRRWLGIRDKVCAFPGCGRLARDCDIDHRTEWQHGGKTAADNAGPLCEHHHVVKTETLWQPTPIPIAGPPGGCRRRRRSPTPTRRPGDARVVVLLPTRPSAAPRGTARPPSAERAPAPCCRDRAP
ncbi:HNH endonuclease signature motif containing protein [Microbacterium elymi]|uniref:HNH endonuclease n=1 Tax=Microbacterium elymi TaxID=2909587 RepID=A0ABY5NLT0_9MICO|nr:HNH endonuclease signature motif containing protein [Microbacterium elymi]UUT36107.1 HNH endonuclease [Microbacterium elymi]